MNVENKKNVINGLFIYNDLKYGCLYYDFFKKESFVITKSDYSAYLKYTRYKVGSILVVFLLMSFFDMQIWLALIIGASLFIVSEVLFRTQFLYKLPIIKNYKPAKKEKRYVKLARDFSLIKLIILTIVSLFTGVLLIIYGKLKMYDGLNIIIVYSLSIFMFIMFIIFILAIIKKQNS